MNLVMGVGSFVVAALGLFAWVVTLVDVTRREFGVSVRVVLFLLVFFLPVVATLVYYLFVVRPGHGLPGGFERGRVLVARRVLSVGVGVAVVLGVFSGLMLVPVGGGVDCVEGPVPLGGSRGGDSPAGRC